MDGLSFGVFGGLNRGVVAGLYNGFFDGQASGLLVSVLFLMIHESAIAPIEKFNCSLRNRLTFGLIGGRSAGFKAPVFWQTNLRATILALAPQVVLESP